MKKVFVFMVAVVFLICSGAEAFAKEKKAEASSPAKAASSTQKPKVVKENVVTKTATVQAIDMKTRKVTLKDKDDNVVDLIVDERAKNLAQVKVGDQVVAKYYESVVVQLENPDTPTGVTTSETSTEAKLGEKPSGTQSKQVTVVATIEAIDPNKTFIVLKGPEGKSQKFQVQDPKNLEQVKVGDQLSITYTLALAISVEKAKKK
jgi:Cu/Ag efflux protein CusF